MIRQSFLAHWLALVLALLTGVLFLLDFFVLQASLPGYHILAWPGIAWLRFFSEEIDFWPKFGLLLLGQYLGCFILAVGLLALRRAGRRLAN